MISSPLFIIVAESIVTFGPMFQVGCASASAGVIEANVSSGRRRKGPPLAVSTSRSTDVGILAAKALPERGVLAVDRDDAGAGRGGAGFDELAGHDQDFLGGGCDRGSRVDRGKRWADRGSTGDRDADDVGIHRRDLAGRVDPDRAARRERAIRIAMDERGAADAETRWRLPRAQRRRVPATAPTSSKRSGNWAITSHA